MYQRINHVLYVYCYVYFVQSIIVFPCCIYHVYLECQINNHRLFIIYQPFQETKQTTINMSFAETLFTKIVAGEIPSFKVYEVSIHLYRDDIPITKIINLFFCLYLFPLYSPSNLIFSSLYPFSRIFNPPQKCNYQTKINQYKSILKIISTTRYYNS